MSLPQYIITPNTQAERAEAQAWLVRKNMRRDELLQAMSKKWDRPQMLAPLRQTLEEVEADIRAIRRGLGMPETTEDHA